MKTETKHAIVGFLLIIALISFIVVLFGFIIRQTIWGMLAIPVCGISFSIALALGMPEDNHGPFAGWRDDGVG